MKRKISRKNSAILNMIFNFIYQGTNTIVNIIIPPLIIGKYGSAINGLISTIKQILAYVQLVGAGISESTVVSLYKPLADDDTDKINSIYNACSITFFRMGVVFNLISLVVALVYPFFIKESFDYTFLVVLILVLSIAGASEFYVIGKYRALLIADQRLYIINIAQTVGSISNLLITIILIYLDANIILIQLGASILYAMRILIVYTYVKKNYLFLDKKCIPNFKAIEKRKAATVHHLSGLVCFGTQTVTISIFCGLIEASIYSVYNLIFNGMNLILSTISSSLLATFGNMLASDDKEHTRKIFSLFETFYYLCVFILYTVTYIMFLSFVDLYTSNVSDVNYIRRSFAMLFCIMGIINCTRTPGATLINAIGHYKETQNRALVEMTICIILQLLLVNIYKSEGVILGTIIAFLYRACDIFNYSNKVILSQSVRQTLKKIIPNLIIFITFMLLVNSFDTYFVNNYFEWILVAIIITSICSIIYLIINFILFKNDFLNIVKILKRKN